MTSRLLWSLCLMQAAVLILSVFGAFYHLIDKNISYIDKSIVDTLASAVSLRPDGLVVVPNQALRQLRDANPGLWAIIADERGFRRDLGTVPDRHDYLVDKLLLIYDTEIHPVPEHPELAVRINAVTRDGVGMHIMVGGVQPSNFYRFITLVTGVLSPYFIVPLVFFTLLATPLVVLGATRSVRELAREAASLDLSNPGARLKEQTVPREVRPLVMAFNEATVRLRSAYYARDRFLRDAAHELRMPIAVLMARVEGMPSHPMKPTLLTDVSRLANVAEELLDLQRLQSPGGELVPLDLVALVRNTLSDMAPLALLRGSELALHAPDEAVWVRGQASALGRVFVNLLQNALVHGGHSARIEVTVEASGTVSVADQGAGIPLEERERIFLPYYRASNQTPGHGLGLYLAQEIIRWHAGHIGVANAEGGGAMFSVHLTAIAPSPVTSDRGTHG
ncbi:MAG: HAMP domain-containing sensor histidine kinase [Rhodocyclaceae bacterium]